MKENSQILQYTSMHSEDHHHFNYNKIFNILSKLSLDT